jgi:uncharacterized protein (TIGR03437 family)
VRFFSCLSLLRGPCKGRPNRVLLCLVLLTAAAAAASSTSFLLGPAYSEWVSPESSAIGTDSSGALYLLTSGCQATGSPASSCVTKLSADGKTILSQSNLGFTPEYNTVAIDPNGGIYTIPPIQAGSITAYVAKLSASGTGLAWQTQVTATGVAIGYPSLVADSQGRAYVGGAVGPAFQSSVVIRLTATGALDYTAQIAGSVTSIAVDATGGVFALGSGVNGAMVPFLARLAPDGSAGFYTSLPSLSRPGSVAVDPNGNAVLTAIAANGSIVLQRYDATGTLQVSSTVQTSTSTQGIGVNFVVDAAGNAYLSGSSLIYDAGVQYLIPVKNSLLTCGSEWLSVFAPDGSLLQGTYLPSGAESVVQGASMATGLNSTVFLLHTAGPGFTPTQTGPFPAGVPGTGVYLWSLSPNANAQTFPLACLGNAATYQTGAIAPGGFVTLFGNGLGPQQGVQPQATLQSPFPTQAASVEVTFDGTPAPLLWVQDAQINVVVPWSLTPGQTTQVCAIYGGVKTNCLTWPVVETAPAVFTASDGVHALALNQDGSLNSATNPAVLGSIVTVFATGLGPITPPQADGALVGLPLPTNTLPVTVGFTVGAPPFGTTIFNPFEVTYAGPAPYEVAGASQINFKLGPPANQTDLYPYAGLQNISVAVPSGTSQPFAVYVANQ